MNNPLEDLAQQRRSRRRRDLAARHCADAATRYLNTEKAALEAWRGGAAGRPSNAGAELAGAVDEWEAARATAPRYYTLRVGRLIVSTMRQHGAPIVDDARVEVGTADDDGPIRTETAWGYTIRLPWADETVQGTRALVVAVVGWRTPQAHRLRPWLHNLGGRHAGGITQMPAGVNFTDDRSVANFAATAAGGPRVLP